MDPSYFPGLSAPPVKLKYQNKNKGKERAEQNPEECSEEISEPENLNIKEYGMMQKDHHRRIQ